MWSERLYPAFERNKQKLTEKIKKKHPNSDLETVIKSNVSREELGLALEQLDHEG